VSCQNLGSTYGNLSVNSTGSFSCPGEGQPIIPVSDNCNNLGSNDEAVIYTVSYCWRPFTPLIGKFFTNGQLTLQSSLVVKNEDFSNATNP
jgi:hypothetical protein